MFLLLLFLAFNIVASEHRLGLFPNNVVSTHWLEPFPDPDINPEIHRSIQYYGRMFPVLENKVTLDHPLVSILANDAQFLFRPDADLCPEPIDPALLTELRRALDAQRKANTGLELTDDEEEILNKFAESQKLPELERVLVLRNRFVEVALAHLGSSLEGMPSVEQEKASGVEERMNSIQKKLDDYNAKGFPAKHPGQKLCKGAEEQHKVLVSKLEERKRQRIERYKKGAQRLIERGISTSESASLVGTPKGSTPSLKRTREDSENPLLQQRPSKKPTNRALFSTSCRDEEDVVGLPEEDDYDSDDLEKCEEVWSLLPPLSDLTK